MHPSNHPLTIHYTRTITMPVVPYIKLGCDNELSETQTIMPFSQSTGNMDWTNRRLDTIQHWVPYADGSLVLLFIFITTIRFLFPLYTLQPLQVKHQPPELDNQLFCLDDVLLMMMSHLIQTTHKTEQLQTLCWTVAQSVCLPLPVQ